MKRIDINALQQDMSRYVDELSEEAIVVTRDGRPCAVMHAVDDDDVESAELANSPEFWRMIEQRRQEPTIPWEEAKRRLKK